LNQKTMRKLFSICLFTLASFFSTSLYAQISFEKHSVIRPFTRSAGLGLSDLDSDGDQDILAGSGTAGLFWFENLGGHPVQWTTRTVDNGIRGCLSVMAADMDLDGVKDLVSSSWDDNGVYWYRNLGTQGWEKRVIDNNCGNAHEIFIRDINGDGNPDVMAAAVTRGEVMLYLNPGTLGQPWSKQVLITEFAGSRTVAAGDLDGDGDEDIVAGAFDAGRITIWKNQGGSPIAWQAVQLVTGLTGAHRVQVIDLNQDGRMDVIGWGYTAGVLAWWENTGADISAWVRHNVDNQLRTSCVGEAKDMDTDGDLDIVTTGYSSNLVLWYENTDGKGTAWSRKSVDTELVEPWMAFAGDLDGDYDLDIIAGGDQGAEICWYEAKTSGRFDARIPAGTMSALSGIYVPPAYDENVPGKLVIALHGSPESKYALTLRDYLIPGAEEAGAVIVSADLPQAQVPGMVWADASVVPQVVAYACKRFHTDPSSIYLLGAAGQGTPGLRESLAGVLNVKGAIAINPELGSNQPGNWTGNAARLVIASDLQWSGYHATEVFSDALWQSGKLIKLLSFEGDGSGYLTDQLSDLLLQGIRYIDSAQFLTSDESGARILGEMQISLRNAGHALALGISGARDREAEIRVYDLTGREIGVPVKTFLTGTVQEIPLSLPSVSGSGIYLLRVTLSDGTGKTIKFFRSA
jgi:hypothetical protein